MARIRTIKPTFWTDEKLAILDPIVRMTFLGLVSAMADDEGRCKGDVRLVKASVWPLDDAVTTLMVGQHLTALSTAGRIIWYEVDGAFYIQIVNWKKHQRIDKARASDLPAPPDNPPTPPVPVVEHSTNTIGTVREPSALDVEVEVEGNRSGIGSGAEPEPEDPAPFRSHVGLPKAALDLLGMFYEPALTERQRERYRDVCSQIWDTIDARHPGPKIRGGVRVKARSVEHLERECKAVMREPPNDRDMAIVFLLKRLTNPESGPTISERIKEREDIQIAEENRYHAAAKSVGIEWAKGHPDEYAPIVAEVDAKYPNAVTGFAKMGRNLELAQRCARAAGFPDFEVWRANERLAKLEESAA